MHQDAQLELLRRAVQHARAGTTDADDRATSFASDIYVSDARLAAERDTLFRHFPLAVAYGPQLKNPGDFVTHDWTGAPILVCRHGDGALRAFLNICRHRGTRLVQAKSGSTEKNFVCPYHAWSFDTEGRLRGVPCGQHFNAVDREKNGLFELPVHEAAGLVFVVPDRDTSFDFARYFAEYATELEQFGLGDWEVYATKIVHGKLNWKMMIEANQESYHINVLHRDTAAPRFAAQPSLFDTLGPHSRTALLHKQFRESNLPSDIARWKILDHSDLVYFLFPNTLILLSNESAHVLTAFPQGKDRAVMQGATLVPKGTSTRFPRMLYEKYWATILEDIAVSEPIQTAAQYDDSLQLWLGANEQLIAHFHTWVRKSITREWEPERRHTSR